MLLVDLGPTRLEAERIDPAHGRDPARPWPERPARGLAARERSEQERESSAANKSRRQQVSAHPRWSIRARSHRRCTARAVGLVGLPVEAGETCFEEVEGGLHGVGGSHERGVGERRPVEAGLVPVGVGAVHVAPGAHVQVRLVV